MAQTVTRKVRQDFTDEHFQPEALAVLEKQLTFWQRFGVSGWGAFVLAVVVIVVLAMRPALIPYPLIYDPDGRMIWHGTAATAREERFIDVRLVEWVAFCRSASSDESRFVEDREACAAMVQGEAAKKFSTYNQASTAAYKDRQRRILVQVLKQQASITPLGKDRVQIFWDEIWTPAVGYGSETHRFQVTLTHAWYARPSGWRLDQARKNPARVYVTDYWWDEVRTEAK